MTTNQEVSALYGISLHIVIRTIAAIVIVSALVTSALKTNGLPFLTVLMFLGVHICTEKHHKQWLLYLTGQEWAHGNIAALLAGARMITVVVSMFFFVPLLFAYEYYVIERNGYTEYKHFLFASSFDPFSDTVWHYSRIQTVSRGGSVEFCTGTTRDGVTLTAQVGARLMLPFENLPIAHAVAGSESGLAKQAVSTVCDRYAEEIKAYDIHDIPSRLVLAASTARETSKMNALGLIYNGVVRVDISNVIVDQSK